MARDGREADTAEDEKLKRPKKRKKKRMPHQSFVTKLLLSCDYAIWSK
jgi:hypothetical protein